MPAFPATKTIQKKERNYAVLRDESPHFFFWATCFPSERSNEKKAKTN
jgi:hypothetical protein